MSALNHAKYSQLISQSIAIHLLPFPIYKRCRAKHAGGFFLACVANEMAKFYFASLPHQRKSMPDPFAVFFALARFFIQIAYVCCGWVCARLNTPWSFSLECAGGVREPNAYCTRDRIYHCIGRANNQIEFDMHGEPFK
jgi:hypothetical protein